MQRWFTVFSWTWVAKDNLQAYVWMFVSRANGDHDNNRMLEKFVKTLTNDEQNKVQDMSKFYLENISQNCSS